MFGFQRHTYKQGRKHCENIRLYEYNHNFNKRQKQYCTDGAGGNKPAFENDYQAYERRKHYMAGEYVGKKTNGKGKGTDNRRYHLEDIHHGDEPPGDMGDEIFDIFPEALFQYAGDVSQNKSNTGKRPGYPDIGSGRTAVNVFPAGYKINNLLARYQAEEIERKDKEKYGPDKRDEPVRVLAKTRTGNLFAQKDAYTFDKVLNSLRRKSFLYENRRYYYQQQKRRNSNHKHMVAEDYLMTCNSKTEQRFRYHRLERV
jgi:hypothetical protein